ncbi:sigma-70 family RNA polymerase sigma factor [Georgenia yuyongxinii]|uniref:Sigma-70 family RNA polymerase sigma factor n=1 Tax=Georgenia yuyongxinii TaxID=2589797 RepID=A0A552WSC8_9MICO|nr:sigma-70 family RNA polymerase sigma factor [Georgenia yuyongxinii]TRW45616.1 sigma-70 family RNA polymerase sigma factor [Georgenia yuyongxinii]
MTYGREQQDELILQNLPLIGYHVSEMIRRVPAHVQRDELAAAGSLALVQAARAFNPELGVPFTRYAAVRVRGAIVDELRGMDWASRGARQRARQLTETSEQLTAALGRKPTRDELAEALGVDVTEVDATRGDVERRVLSIDADGAGAAESLTSSGLGPEERVLVSERLRYLTAGVEELPERLRHVVEELFFRDRPVVDLAAEMGVTQSRISQLRTQALGMLRDAMNSSLEPDLAPEPTAEPGVAERRRRAYYAAVAERASGALARNGGEVSLQGSRPTVDVG